MRPVTVSVRSSVAAANNISLTQSLAVASALILNGSIVSGGVAQPTSPSYIGITSGGNDSGITWTVSGTDPSGAVQSETIQGGNGVLVTTTHKFATVNNIVGSGATASTVTAGTPAFLYSDPIPVDLYLTPLNIGLQFSTDGNTTAFEVDYSMNDPFSYTGPDDFNAHGGWFAHASMTAMTMAAAGSIVFPVRAVRLKSNQAGTNVGTLVVIQSGP